MIGIYLITNKVNGKKYVGQSIDIEERWKDHIWASKKSELLIYRAMRKYGIDNFDFSILEECSIDKLDEREIYWISELDTYNNGYNMTIGGKGHNLYLDPKEREQKKKEVARRSSKKYRDSHKEERRELQRKYRKNNPDYVKKWEEKHKEERNRMWRERARRLRMEKKLKNDINTIDNITKNIMSKFFSILVPYFNEGEEVIKNLLDSIAIQQNIDMKEIEVVICKDGPDGPELSQEFLDKYPYDIQYHREAKANVSVMRNKALDYSTGEYVTWADADDMYYTCLALWFVKRETQTPMQVPINGVPTTVNGFDALYAVFLEEGRNPQTGETYFIDRAQGNQFVHSKFFKKEFLLRNDIRFGDDLVINEDNVLDGKVQACTQNIKWCPSPFYLWKWRDNSVCRRDPLYLKKTYPDLIKSSNHMMKWYISKSKFDNARQAVASIVLDSYYTFCHPSWKEIGTKEYRDKAEKCFADYFKKWEYLWNECPDQVKMQISSGIRQREVIQGMEMETETLEQYLNRMRKLGENQ